MEARELSPHALPELAAALRADGMPADDLGAPGQVFWRFTDANDAAVGYAGLEIHGGDALLRSVLIEEAARGRGHGREMVETILGEARHRGIGRLWLLTMDAAGFFDRLGFARVERGQVPPAIAATAEFKSLCPASAACMRLDLACRQAEAQFCVGLGAAARGRRAARDAL